MGLLDGPVAAEIPFLATENIRVTARDLGSSPRTHDTAGQHGTFVAGVLCGRRSSPAPAICPECTLVVQPIFGQVSRTTGEAIPAATPEELATAIVHIVDTGVHVLNLSVALIGRSPRDEGPLRAALDYAMRRGTLVVAAAGNQGLIGGSTLTVHPWVISVAAYGLRGRVLDFTNLGASVGKRGLGAPGERITSVTANGEVAERTGTSVAAPFVTGAIALLWSQRPNASPTTIKSVLLQASTRARRIVPPLLDAWGAYVRLRELA